MKSVFACMTAAFATLGLGAEGIMKQQDGMVLIPAREVVVGTSPEERAELAKRPFTENCHPTWLNDDLPKHTAKLAAFWIDRYPVTNGEYLAFVQAKKPTRPGWWGAAFPAEYAKHPVVGVSGKDAAAYAKWAGKRLPTAEEWEAAIGGSRGKLFAWGDDWPGLVKLPHIERPFWELPATCPVGTGERGRSAAGIEDFAGQATEWVADVRPHHGVQFQLMKGASWFHEDPVNFRTASGGWATEGWASGFSGFRCALDGDKAPSAVRRMAEAMPANAPTLASVQGRLAGKDATGPLIIAAAGGKGRYVSIRAPELGHEGFGLSAPETIIWNGKGALSWFNTPDMEWTKQTPSEAAYEMRFPEFRLTARFVAQADSVDQIFTATNLTAQPATFRTSSCFNLQGHPNFYDPEQRRTFALGSDGKFIPMRRLSRGGDCIRWITGANQAELGENRRWAFLAVVSRDGKWVIASGRGGEGKEFGVATNTYFTCLHTDSTIDVPPNGRAETRQRLYFLRGTLEDVARRFHEDFGRKE